jgi:hypothetical protein
MITEQDYNNARQVINDYISQQLNIPVVNHSRFLELLKVRVDMCEEVIEMVGYLSYDLNPIGGREDMFDAMKKNALEQIIELNLKLEEIRKSLCDCG